ncbi:winged helix-turn-helix domain-containing protein [Streptomyces flavofungini]|uniref:winged helix-turn-helix domain-containing protein n=1 Tax=Streptomyces flavofungini TaxID=68200 RepID=UPI0025B0AFB9|nr:helix-turn-helix domain-containing protein [Streptomyces flavofungini]WJV49360.1 helix-turn-helix domain-containing protein [Streptomyces flavofungini]
MTDKPGQGERSAGDRPEDRRITDLGTLKAFGHPLRLKLYRSLYVRRRATASQLADEVDGAVALVSYHLRKLAEHGLIEEAPGAHRGDGRERWWQPAQQGLSLHRRDFEDAPEKLAAHSAVTRVIVDQRTDAYLRYLDEQPAWSPEWQAAADGSDYLLRLTAAELAELSGELRAVINKYVGSGDAAHEAGDDAGRENVALHLYSFPFRT